MRGIPKVVAVIRSSLRSYGALRGVTVALWVVAAATSPTIAAAQQPARPRAITGVVEDTTGNFVDSADVAITALKRRTVSALDGTFAFDDIRPGTYDVSARRFGYAPQVRTVTVGANGGRVTFRLVPVPHGLPAVVSSAVRGGLSGVIGDTAYNVVGGASISIVGSDRRTTSDSTGQFFLDLRPGRYMVRVERDGYLASLIGVHIPNDSGRKVVVWLTPGTPGAKSREAWALDGLQDRMTHRTALSTIYTREDIVRTGMTELSQLATIGSSQPVDDTCPVIVNGGPEKRYVWEIQAADIETVEIYPPGTLLMPGVSALRFKPPTSLYNNAPMHASGSPAGRCSVQLYVWLRK